MHQPGYLDAVEEAAPTQGIVHLDPDTAMNPHTLTAALRAAGAAVLATDMVINGDVKTAFCDIRPPGHHACRSRAMGFCLFNNVAVAAAHAMEQHGLERVAIVDFDVHHGNGTEDIFRDDARVLMVSTFQHPFYPYSGIDGRSARMVNIPLAAYSTGRSSAPPSSSSGCRRSRHSNRRCCSFRRASMRTATTIWRCSAW